MLDKKSMAKTVKNKEKIPELLTLTEACNILKCHPNTLRQWDKKGILIAIRIRIKRVMHYKKEDILRFTKK